jgi:hypothetical protein
MQKLCDEIVMENMIEEARLTMEACPLQSAKDFERWKESLTDKTMPQLTESQMPKVSASYDMAWQQKGSGHVYNSQSGHGTMMGKLTCKIISLGIKSKLCNQCNAYARKGTPVLEQGCWKNHVGSSGSMESAACLELVFDIFDNKHAILARSSVVLMTLLCVQIANETMGIGRSTTTQQEIYLYQSRFGRTLGRCSCERTMGSFHPMLWSQRLLPILIIVAKDSQDNSSSSAHRRTRSN